MTLSHTPGDRRQQPPALGLRHSTNRRGVTTLTLALFGDFPIRNHRTETDVSTDPGRLEGAATRPTGEWPIPRSRPELHLARLAETHPNAGETRARHHIVIGAIRAILEDQPSPRTVRSASRRLCNSIVQLAAEVAEAKREAA